MDYVLYSNDCAKTEATVIKLNLADSAADPDPIVSKLRLYDGSVIPTAVTTKAQLEAAEVTFTGYPTGGYPITAFTGPLFLPGGGAYITANMVVVIFTTGEPATVGGWFLEDSTGAVRVIGVYNPQRQLAQVGDGWQVIVQLAYGRNTIPTGG